MPRQARVKSKTGIYHIMLRGIDKRNIFLDEEDKIKFIEKLKRAKERVNFELYGYCLMNNHVHLLIKESEDIGESIKRITVGYVQWNNNKYGRVGHLFQNRYLSEPVESEAYLINVLRYIHQNPLKAKITNNLSEYPWSSYNFYISKYENHESIVDTELMRDYFKTQRDFEEYMNAKNNDDYLEYKETIKYTEAMLKHFIEKDIDIQKFNELPSNDRNKKIKELYKCLGVSIRQLSRVLGLGKSIIEKAVK